MEVQGSSVTLVDREQRDARKWRPSAILQDVGSHSVQEITRAEYLEYITVHTYIRIDNAM